MEYYGAGFHIQSSLDIIRHLSTSNFRFAGHHFSAFYSLYMGTFTFQYFTNTGAHIHNDDFLSSCSNPGLSIDHGRHRSSCLVIWKRFLPYRCKWDGIWLGFLCILDRCFQKKYKIHHFRADHHHFIFRNVCIYVSKC